MLALARSEAKATGLPMSQILVGGFDQGAVVALNTVLTAAAETKYGMALRESEAAYGDDLTTFRLFGGLIMHGGWVPRTLGSGDRIRAGLQTGLTAQAAKIPILILHGAIDKIVPVQRAKAGAMRLRHELGLSDVTLVDDYACGHSIDGPMLLDIITFVRRVFSLAPQLDEELQLPLLPPPITPTVNPRINAKLAEQTRAWRGHEL